MSGSVQVKKTTQAAILGRVMTVHQCADFRVVDTQQGSRFFLLEVIFTDVFPNFQQ